MTTPAETAALVSGLKNIKDSLSRDMRFVSVRTVADAIAYIERTADQLRTRPKKPWCDTCGKDVHEVLCPTCAKWWADNPPPADPREGDVERVARSLAESEIRKNRRHDTDPATVDQMIAEGVVEYFWREWIEPASAAIKAMGGEHE